MSVNERANVHVDIDGEGAGKKIEKLVSQTREWKKELKDLKKSGEPIDPNYIDHLNKKIKEGEREIKSYKNQMKDLNYVLNNLSKVSYQDLINTQRKLKEEIKRSTRETVEEINVLKRKEAQLKQVQAEMARFNGQSQKNGLSLNKMADGFNRYFGMITAFTASLVGVVMGFKQINDMTMEFEERVDNLGALTGLAGDELAWLEENAKKTSVAMVEGGIRIKQGATDIIDAYTKMGSQRPELLKNREALAAVTLDGILLSEAAKMELDPAIDALANTMNQFNLSADESRRIINVLAAGSKEGAAAIPYLSQAVEKAGTTANLMGISLEQTVGIIEAIAPKFAKAELAGNSLDKVLLKMKDQNIGYSSGVFDMNDALDELKTRFQNGESATSIFGVEHAKMVEVLVQAQPDIEKFTGLVTGTSIAMEQAYKNTNNQAAVLAQARNEYQLTAMELGKELGPAITFSTNGFTYLLKAIVGSMRFFKEYKAEIATITAGLIAYGVAVKIAASWTKIKAAWEAIELAFLIQKETATNLLTGKMKLATYWQQLWNAAQKANPIGIVIGLLAAAGTALYFYTKRLTAAEKAQKELNDINKKALISIADEKAKLESLITVARDETISRDKRAKAIKELNELSPDYLGSLTLETINTLEATAATEKYIESLVKKAKMEAVLEKLKDTETSIIELQADGTGAAPTFWQKLGNSVMSFGSVATEAYRNAATYAKNYNQEENNLLETKKQLLATLTELAKEEIVIDPVVPPGGGGGGGGDKPKFNPKNLNNDEVQQIIALSEQKIAAYEQANAAEVAVLEENYKKEKAVRQIENNKLLVNFKGTEEEKKKLSNKFKQQELAREIEHLNQLSLVLNKQLQQGIGLEGVVLSDEQKKELQKRIDELKLKISELGVEIKNIDDAGASGLVKSKLDQLSEKISKAAGVAQTLVNSLGGIFSALADKENADLEQYEINVDKRKELLERQLSDGVISQSQYNAQVVQLDNKADAKRRELANKQAQRNKAMAIVSAVINTAQAVSAALTIPVAGIALAAIVGALGLIQIGIIAGTKVPQYAQGNWEDVVGATDGRTYRAKKGSYGTQMVDGPTLIPGIGLVGEGYKPRELVFSGEDTTRIMNSPALLDAINYTITTPQFASGNYPSNTTTTQSMQTDRMESILMQILLESKKPKKNFITYNDFLNMQDEYNTMMKDVSS